MINFFRHIRKSLLMKNKTGQYLKYALGEVALVVLGILIALQINNWNENKKDRLKEAAILKELNKDFKGNLKQFKNVSARHFKALESTKKFKKYIHHPNLILVKDSIAKYYFQAFDGVSYNPSNGVIESLIASGEYQLITNDSLRNYIISWKDVLQDYLENESYDGNLWTNKIEPYLIDNGDLVNLGNPINLQLITTPKFTNLTERHLLYLNNIVNTIREEPLEEYIKGITRLSEQENDN